MRFGLFIFSLLVLCSCKKDKLEGGSSPLIGTWDWRYTTYFNSCSIPGSEKTTYADSVNYSYSLRFHEKGIIEFLQNGEVIQKNRIVMDELSWYINYGTENCYYNIELNNNPKTTLRGSINKAVDNSWARLQTVKGTPFYTIKTECDSYYSYFDRQ